MKLSFLSLQNFSLYFYFFSLNVESLNIGGVFSISKFAAILYLICVLPNFNFFFKIDKRLYNFLSPLFIFILILTLNSLFNINEYSNKVIDVTVLLNILIFIAIINHSSKDNQVLDKAIFIFALGSIFVSILLFLEIGLDINLETGRRTLFGANANELGIKLSTSVIILCTIIFNNILKLKKYRYLLLFFIPLMLISIINTGSRSSLLVLLLSISIFVAIKIINNKNKIYSLLTSLIFLIVTITPILYFSLQNEILIERILITSEGGELALGGREILWLSMISIAIANPFLGYGYSGFENECYKLFGFVDSPHNLILEIILYTGLIGLFFYLIFLFKIFHKSYKIYVTNKTILPLLFISPILAFILANQALVVKFCWMLFAYMIGTILINSKRQIDN